MPFIKKLLKTTIQLVSTTEIREDDLQIALDRSGRGHANREPAGHLRVDFSRW